jgi:hypothetical protein
MRNMMALPEVGRKLMAAKKAFRRVLPIRRQDELSMIKQDEYRQAASASAR